MSIIESYQKKLDELKEQREQVSKLSTSIPDMRYIIMQIDAQIRDCEARINKLTSIHASIKCSQCEQWVAAEEEENMVNLGESLICPSCLKTISQVYTAQDAEERWGLRTGTIKQDCRRGKLETYINAGLIRKSGKYWLVHELVKKQYEDKKTDR